MATMELSNRSTANVRDAFVPVWNFVAGYAVIWSTFSIAATVAQFTLKAAGLLSPTTANVETEILTWEPAQQP
jgi:predicted metal-binding membrane protein